MTDLERVETAVRLACPDIREPVSAKPLEVLKMNNNSSYNPIWWRHICHALTLIWNNAEIDIDMYGDGTLENNNMYKHNQHGWRCKFEILNPLTSQKPEVISFLSGVLEKS